MQAIEQPTPIGYGEGPTLEAGNPQTIALSSKRSNAGARACTMCVKAKAKCMPHAEIEGVCQRCHRLKKQCFLHERSSRKHTRMLKPTRVAQLEQKLEGLVTLLTSNQSNLQPNPLSQALSAFQPRSPLSLDSSASPAGPYIATPQSINSDGGTTPIEILSNGFTPADLVCTAIAGELSITSQGLSQIKPDEQEAATLLLEFMANMAEQFPFVVIHPDSTSESLHHEKPLFWKAIMVAASHRSSDRQMALGANLLEDLTTRLLFRAERSLDLLQALLVFIAWYHYHTLVNPQMTNLLHLAKALINNMGLNRTPTTYDRGKFFLDGHDLKSGVQSSQWLGLNRSDGWRALAGCFYLTSVISASFRGLEPQFNTSYIVECCLKLGDAGEYKSDTLLVQLVRLQEIRYRIGRSFPYDEFHGARSPDVPVDMFVRAWQKDLEAFWASLPAESQQNRLLLATYYSAEFALYEIYLNDFPKCQPRAPVKVVGRTGRLEFIYASLLATKRVFDVYTSVPVERLSGLCFTLWAQFNHALLNAFKLLTSEIDGWDLQHARDILTFPNILHCQVKAIEEVITSRGLVLETAMDGKDVFPRFRSRVQHALRWYESSRASRIEPQESSDQLSDPNGYVGAIDLGESLPVFDDAFWQNLFADNWMLVDDGLST